MGTGAAKVGSVGNENRQSRFLELLIPNLPPTGATEVGSVDIENRSSPFDESLSLKTPVVVRARAASMATPCQNATGSTQRRRLILRGSMADRGVGGQKSKKVSTFRNRTVPHLDNKTPFGKHSNDSNVVQIAYGRQSSLIQVYSRWKS